MIIMIREILNTAITEITRNVLPDAVADKWSATNFTILFPVLKLINPTTMDDKLEIIAEMQGSVAVRFFTDKAIPIDLTSLFITLRENPIIINPATDTTMHEYSVQLVWKPDYIKDEVYDGIISTQMVGEIRNGYVFKKVAESTLPAKPTNVFVFFPNAKNCYHPRSIGAVPLDMLMSELKQRKLAIHTSIENGLFSLYPTEDTLDYTASGHDSNMNLGENANDFNNSGSIQILLNGRLLEKAIAVLYVSKHCFRYTEIVDQGDFFIALTP